VYSMKLGVNSVESLCLVAQCKVATLKIMKRIAGT